MLKSAQVIQSWSLKQSGVACQAWPFAALKKMSFLCTGPTCVNTVIVPCHCNCCTNGSVVNTPSPAESKLFPFLTSHSHGRVLSPPPKRRHSSHDCHTGELEP